MNISQFRKLINLFEASYPPSRSKQANVLLDGIAALIGTPLQQCYEEQQQQMESYSQSIGENKRWTQVIQQLGRISADWMYEFYYGKLETELYNLIKQFPNQTVHLKIFMKKSSMLANKDDPTKQQKPTLKFLTTGLPYLLEDIGKTFGHSQLVTNATRWGLHADALDNMYSWYQCKDVLEKPKFYATILNRTPEEVVTLFSNKLAKVENNTDHEMFYTLGLDLDRFIDPEELKKGKLSDKKSDNNTDPTAYPNRPSWTEPRKNSKDYYSRSLDPNRPSIDTEIEPYTSDSSSETAPINQAEISSSKNDSNKLTPFMMGKTVFTRNRTFRPQDFDPLDDRSSVRLTPREKRDILTNYKQSAKTIQNTTISQRNEADALITDLITQLSKRLPADTVTSIVSKIASAPNKLLGLQAELKQRGLEWVLTQLKPPSSVSKSTPTTAPKSVSRDKVQPTKPVSADPVSKPIRAATASSVPPALAKLNKAAPPASVVYKRKLQLDK